MLCKNIIYHTRIVPVAERSTTSTHARICKTYTSSHNVCLCRMTMRLVGTIYGTVMEMFNNLAVHILAPINGVKPQCCAFLYVSAHILVQSPERKSERRIAEHRFIRERYCDKRIVTPPCRMTMEQIITAHGAIMVVSGGSAVYVLAPITVVKRQCCTFFYVSAHILMQSPKRKSKRRIMEHRLVREGYGDK